jgi:hypothetical protein
MCWEGRDGKRSRRKRRAHRRPLSQRPRIRSLCDDCVAAARGHGFLPLPSDQPIARSPGFMKGYVKRMFLPKRREGRFSSFSPFLHNAPLSGRVLKSYLRLLARSQAFIRWPRCPPQNSIQCWRTCGRDGGRHYGAEDLCRLDTTESFAYSYRFSRLGGVC